MSQPALIHGQPFNLKPIQTVGWVKRSDPSDKSVPVLAAGAVLHDGPGLTRDFVEYGTSLTVARSPSSMTGETQHRRSYRKFASCWYFGPRPSALAAGMVAPIRPTDLPAL